MRRSASTPISFNVLLRRRWRDVISCTKTCSTQSSGSFDPSFASDHVLPEVHCIIMIIRAHTWNFLAATSWSMANAASSTSTGIVLRRHKANMSLFRQHHTPDFAGVLNQCGDHIDSERLLLG